MQCFSNVLNYESKEPLFEFNVAEFPIEPGCMKIAAPPQINILPMTLKCYVIIDYAIHLMNYVYISEDIALLKSG